MVGYEDGRTVKEFEVWSKEIRQLADDARAERWTDLAAKSRKLIEIYPDYVEDQSPYLILALAEEKLGRNAERLAALEAYARRGGKSPEHLKQLAKLLAGAGQDEQAIAAYRRLLYITPTGDDDLHRQLGQLHEKRNQWLAAAVEYNAIASAKPVDPAAAHFDVARVLYAAGKLEEARSEVMQSLEAAPGYRAAQKLLLQLEAASGKKD